MRNFNQIWRIKRKRSRPLGQIMWLFLLKSCEFYTVKLYISYQEFSWMKKKIYYILCTPSHIYIFANCISMKYIIIVLKIIWWILLRDLYRFGDPGFPKGRVLIQIPAVSWSGSGPGLDPDPGRVLIRIRAESWSGSGPGRVLIQIWAGSWSGSGPDLNPYRVLIRTGY